MTNEPKFETADEIHTVQFDAVIGEGGVVELNEEELEELGVSSGDIVRVSVSKIPDEE